MAVIPWVVDTLPTGNQLPTGIKVVRWDLLAAADTGTPYYCPQFAGKAVQRTAGAGTYTLEGTLIPEGITPVFGTLHSPNMADITAIADNEIYQVLEDCYAVRPVAAGAALTVYLFISTTARR